MARPNYDSLIPTSLKLSKHPLFRRYECRECGDNYYNDLSGPLNGSNTVIGMCSVCSWGLYIFLCEARRITPERDRHGQVDGRPSLLSQYHSRVNKSPTKSDYAMVTRKCWPSDPLKMVQGKSI